MHMAATNDLLTVIEECRISAPPHTVGERTLALTFFDLAYLLREPVQKFFAYEFPHSKTHFTQTVIPNLKHSLSITLQHFFPFAGNLIVFPFPKESTPTKPEIRHVEGDSVALTFAECHHLDFNDLKGNHPRECHKFYSLVPALGSGEKVSNLMKIPLFSVQVTLFPNTGGITIGLTNHHVLCDASTMFDFLRAWTTIAESGTDEVFLATGVLPFYDRSVIEYPNDLDQFYLNQPGIESLAIEYHYPKPKVLSDKVRATVVLTQAQISQLKRWVSTKLPTLEYISSLSVTCAYVWSCIAKSRARHGLEMFVFAVDCRKRLNPPIPQSYFGNCIGPGVAKAESASLSATSGFVVAVELLGKALSAAVKNNGGVIKDAGTWSGEFGQGVPMIAVAGTPKLKVYDLDFGWGKLEKYEIISIDHFISAISVSSTKESPQDIEIGLSLPTQQMEAFLAISKNELQRMDVTTNLMN